MRQSGSTIPQSQYALDDGSPLTPTKTESPERNLLASILARAICDIVNNRINDLIWKERSLDWIDHQGNEYFSFNYKCKHLDLEPDELRNLIMKWQENKTEFLF